jgi:GTP-binding protein YchF
MKLGIVGLPNSGKSALFNSLTQGGAQSSNYAFSTVTPNAGVAEVPDPRLEVLAEIYKTNKITRATIEFVDIAGLTRGASRGEGLGNKFLAHIREADAIIHVVRCFEDENIFFPEPDIDPIRDIETVNLELILADLEVVEKRMARTKQNKKELDALNKIKEFLENEKFARDLVLNDDEIQYVDSLNLITNKKALYAANIKDKSDPNVKILEDYARSEGAEAIAINAKMEEEIAELEPSERAAFFEEMGETRSGLDRLISVSYKTLGLISFLTAGPKEARAWTVKNGTKAPGAAGKIHSDIERGFIRAEIVSYNDMEKYRNYNTCKEKGLVRLEGKEYVVKENDVILFRFNV